MAKKRIYICVTDGGIDWVASSDPDIEFVEISSYWVETEKDSLSIAQLQQAADLIESKELSFIQEAPEIPKEIQRELIAKYLQQNSSDDEEDEE